MNFFQEKNAHPRQNPGYAYAVTVLCVLKTLDASNAYVIVYAVKGPVSCANTNLLTYLKPTFTH